MFCFFRSFVPPVRDEESETQRKAHAKRVRETRRSTQGVTLEEVKTAEQLAKKKQAETVGFKNNKSLLATNQLDIGGKKIRRLLQYLQLNPSRRKRVIQNLNWSGGHRGDYASTITIKTRLLSKHNTWENECLSLSFMCLQRCPSLLPGWLEKPNIPEIHFPVNFTPAVAVFDNILCFLSHRFSFLSSSHWKIHGARTMVGAVWMPPRLSQQRLIPSSQSRCVAQNPRKKVIIFFF